MKNEIEETLEACLGQEFKFEYLSTTSEGYKYKLSSTITKKVVVVNFFQIHNKTYIQFGKEKCAELNERNLLLALFLTVYLT